MLCAFEFDAPDRIPVVCHPSPAGLHVHGQKLLDLFNAYPPDNPVTFDAIPSPPRGTVSEDGTYHEISTDDWGTQWEYLIFGVHGHPRKYPFESWTEASDYAFPPLPPIDTTELAQQREQYLLFAGWNSIFEKMHALRPIDELLIDIVNEDAALLRFLDRLVDYWLTDIERMIDAGVDVIMFGDDWGTQEAPIISPQSFRRIFKPRYRTMMAPVRAAGRKIFFHSCGCLDETLDDLIDLGIDGLWPQIGLMESNPSLLETCRSHHVAMYIHPDRQYLVPKGSPRAIEAAIRGYAETHHALRGGGIFYIEIENDAPFENVKALIESVDRWR